MKLVNNWVQVYKSLAVWLPTLAVFALAMIDAAIQTNLVPVQYMPIVVAVSGFIGRVIKQDSMEK